MKVLLFLLRYGPTIWSIFKNLLDMLDDLPDDLKGIAKKDLKVAMSDSKLAKDLAPIKSFSDRVTNACSR